MNWAEHLRVFHRLTGKTYWLLKTPQGGEIVIHLLPPQQKPWKFYNNKGGEPIYNEANDEALNKFIPIGTELI